jgi:hypothetical protein
VAPVACELRSPATAFGRVELFSFFSFPPDLRPGLLSAVPTDWSLQGAASRCCPHRRCGEFAAEVDGVVLGTVQDGVDVVEDVPLLAKEAKRGTHLKVVASEMGCPPTSGAEA